MLSHCFKYLFIDIFSRKIVGFDVYENENELFFKDHSQTIVQDDLFERLQMFNNVLITPHQAFYTHEAVTEITKITIKNFSDFENNLPLENEVF